MAEFCKFCFMKIHSDVNKQEIIMSDEKYLCESCGIYNEIVERLF